MQTNIVQEFLATDKGKLADDILRSCVHCGFCLATCPTYTLLGDELDSPRGRIYQIKSMLEGNEVSNKTMTHLDRCLTCRSCETTCPSGVEYGHLLDIGREMVEEKGKRPLWLKAFRFAVRKGLTTPWLFNLGINIFPFLRHSKAKAFTPEESNRNKSLATTIGEQEKSKCYKNSVLLLAGCVQPALAPNINRASIKVLNRLSINVIETSQDQCCGAVDQHLSATDDATKQIKRNIDAWLPYLEQGAQGIISNASGCGVMVKDYAHLLKDDSEYAKKATLISEATKDISEFLLEKDLSKLEPTEESKQYKNAMTFHSPCTLQHGQKLQGVVEDTLKKLGFSVNPVNDSHLCCGSAGTYSIFEPKISKTLRKNKLNNLEVDKPDVIVTANIGCLMHLQNGTKTPVKHWVEVI